jgi:hypothetical protein
MTDDRRPYQAPAVLERISLEDAAPMPGELTYTAPANTVPSRWLVTSVRVWCGPSHDVVRVWNRGGFAGALIMCHGDGALFAATHGLVLAGS